LEPGHRADLIVLDPDHPTLVGRGGDDVVDSWLFSGEESPVRDVMVSGRWVVRDGRHHAQEAILAAYARVAERLADR
jgi:formimidoylglutamate deiminase